MNHDELDQLNDRTLEQDEKHRLEPDDGEEDYYDENGCCEADNWAEDEYMDERDGF